MISDYYLSDLSYETFSEKESARDGDILLRFLKRVTESEVTLKELDGLYTKALCMELMLAPLEVN